MRLDITASFRAFGAFRIGASPVIDNERGIEQAVELARQCDAVVVCAGLNQDYESEGCESRIENALARPRLMLQSPRSQSNVET